LRELDSSSLDFAIVLAYESRILSLLNLKTLASAAGANRPTS